MMTVENYLFYFQISSCKSLAIIEMSSFVNLPVTKLLKIEKNPSLVYMHPGKIVKL